MMRKNILKQTGEVVSFAIHYSYGLYTGLKMAFFGAANHLRQPENSTSSSFNTCMNVATNSVMHSKNAAETILNYRNHERDFNIYWNVRSHALFASGSVPTLSEVFTHHAQTLQQYSEARTEKLQKGIDAFSGSATPRIISDLRAIQNAIGEITDKFTMAQLKNLSRDSDLLNERGQKVVFSAIQKNLVKSGMVPEGYIPPTPK